MMHRASLFLYRLTSASCCMYTPAHHTPVGFPSLAPVSFPNRPIDPLPKWKPPHPASLHLIINRHDLPALLLNPGLPRFLSARLEVVVVLGQSAEVGALLARGDVPGGAGVE